MIRDDRRISRAKISFETLRYRIRRDLHAAEGVQGSDACFIICSGLPAAASDERAHCRWPQSPFVGNQEAAPGSWSESHRRSHPDGSLSVAFAPRSWRKTPSRTLSLLPPSARINSIPSRFRPVRCSHLRSPPTPLLADQLRFQPRLGNHAFSALS